MKFACDTLNYLKENAECKFYENIFNEITNKIYIFQSGINYCKQWHQVKWVLLFSYQKIVSPMSNVINVIKFYKTDAVRESGVY